MSEIHKIVCDACGREKDFRKIYFGRDEASWQELYFEDEHRTQITKHACCIDCAIKILNEENK